LRYEEEISQKNIPPRTAPCHTAEPSIFFSVIGISLPSVIARERERERIRKKGQNENRWLEQK
jgi:hypothetical protein